MKTTQGFAPHIVIQFILERCLLLVHKRTQYRLQTQERMSQARDIYHQGLWGSLHKHNIKMRPSDTDIRDLFWIII